jgi:protein transport protein YIF1
VLFIRIGCYFLNITSNLSFLELFAYTGYKYVPVNSVMTVKLFNLGTTATVGVFCYMVFAFGFFTVF